MIAVYKQYPQIWKKDVNKNKLKNRFVIHEHKADRAGLHYDLRISHDETLKCWVSRKMPEFISGSVSKIQLHPTPDHDLSWLDFKGEIEDGYGKGLVDIWDTGSIKIIKWTDDSKVIYFNGRKINGNYSIIKVYGDKYLFIKNKTS